jgi:uncharacterized protein YbjQ (UPF0145 family)
MILTTADQIEGKRITEDLGIVAGEAILGIDISRDLVSRLCDIPRSALADQGPGVAISS